MIKLKWGVVLTALLLLNGLAFAGDSFVGNGGSAGDLELLVAKKQLQETFYKIPSSDLKASLCKCEPVFEGRGECSPLEGLKEEEVSYCAEKLQGMSGEAGRMLAHNRILFRWTKEEIFVRQDSKTSTADAVANSANDTITLNQQRFLALTDTERLFLLAHEIFHLVPNGEDRSHLSDEGAVGPYKGAQGSRRLLNAMAAGAVVEAYRNKSIQSYKHILVRRKSYSKNWFDLTLTPSGEASDTNESVYAQESFGGFSVGYRRYFGSVGIGLKYTKLQSDDRILLNTDVSEDARVFGVGLSYRFYPVKNPLSFWGQSFVNIDLHLETMTGEVLVADQFTSLVSKDRSSGGSIDIKYYIPLQLCWVHIGGGVRNHELSYSELNFKNDKPQPYLNIGASYAF